MINQPVHQAALIVQNLKQTNGFFLVTPSEIDQIKASLVVWKLDRQPLDALLKVELLLCLENTVVKVLLQPLVGKVDAELL